MQIAHVIVSINNANVDKPFSYIIPDNMCEKAVRGARVVVPFGRGNKPTEGFIVDIVAQEETAELPLKNIMDIPDKAPLVHEDLMLLARWMQDKYYSTMTECIKCIMPAGISIKTETLYTLNSVIEYDLDDTEQAVVDYAMTHSPVSLQTLVKSIKGLTTRQVNALVQKNILLKDQVTTNKDFTLYERYIELNINVPENTKPPGERTKQGQVMAHLQKQGKISVKALREALGITNSPIAALVEKGLANYVMVETRRVTAIAEEENTKGLILNDEQKQALETILALRAEKEKKPVLLHGVTGSGKTEVYLKAIEAILSEGKQAIVLVPEISLTPQTVGRFKNRFGDKVSVTHSRLSMAERYDQWKNAAEGRISIMIGPRSALFAPFSNLGMIIIDEEHENTYKSETTPKYDARLTAIERARLTDAILIMGSATPSMESYYNALNKDYILVTMKKRVNLTMPAVDTVDMRIELEEGNRSIFSVKLADAILENANHTVFEPAGPLHLCLLQAVRLCGSV